MNTGKRMTRQRRIILDDIRKNRIHPTADEVYKSVRKRLPRISLGTVYRNLDLLARTGEIRKISIAGKQMRFDGDKSDHMHITCVRCGKLTDIPDDPRYCDVCRETLADSGFVLQSVSVELFGVCPDCREDEDEER
ncbi:MAG: transcriptional repressor [Candidatus Krumholzibacteria bacterium]|nr:transcriptional repressor [Candidatus Krumholzibacteria bacterium]